MMWHYGWGYGWSFLDFLWPLLWILLIVALFRGFGRWGHRWHDKESAEKILRERFARGEIKEKEYRERLEVLREEEKR